MGPRKYGNIGVSQSFLIMKHHVVVIAGEAASQGVTIHSIAFYTTGGGVPEIAKLTGGSYREIHTTEGLAD